MKEKKIWLFELLLLACSALTVYLYFVSVSKWKVALFVICLIAFFIEGGGMFALLFSAKKIPVKRNMLFSSLCGLVYVGIVFLITYVINVVNDHGHGIGVVMNFITLITVISELYIIIRLMMITKVKFVWHPLICIILILCFTISGLSHYIIDFQTNAHIKNKRFVSDPIAFSSYTKAQQSLMNTADYYVSLDGDDNNDGTKAHPFATIEKARDTVRGIDKTTKNGIIVALKTGEYCVRNINFTAEDSGTASCPIKYCAYGDGEVLINGGKVLEPSLFSKVTDSAVLSRLSEDAKNKVYTADLTALGLTIDDWGKLYPVGEYGTANKYDGDTTGSTPCTLYFNGKTMTTARYPDNGFLTVQSVIREGEWQFISNPDKRNPETTIFTVDQTTADRINTYASLENVWLWTALKFNWADCTVPLKNFDYANKTLEPTYAARYGAVTGGTYYIFNVIEELDAPGEWFLDRENGILYIYPPEDIQTATINIALSTETIFNLNGTDNLIFDGLTVCGTRGNGFALNGNDNTVSNCYIYDIAGNAVNINGYRNKVTDSEIAHIGAYGVDMRGGDRQTLTRGENRVENCLIHNYSEAALTAGRGIYAEGVGNVISHNELYDSPQLAIDYRANDLIVEYNYIHDVALLSDDCAAIYSGKREDAVGNVIRYNVLYNLGDKDHSPNGIYWDDGLCGQTAYGNLIVNCKGSAFLMGGGRNNVAFNNIIINAGYAFSYDDRVRLGIVFYGDTSFNGVDYAFMQRKLAEVPWQEDTWQNAYPYMRNWTLDTSYPNDTYLAYNPAESKITNNLIISDIYSIGNIDQSIYRFSDISDNTIFMLNAMKRIFVDPENGDYRLRDDSAVYNRLPDFEPLPLDKVGRIN